MLQIRHGHERGHADYGWLDTNHTFSFGGYFDPGHMGFRSLRVINDDVVEAGRGFGTHGHENMEIVSYVVEGALEHRDSLGTGSVLRAGDVQRISAGSGVTHSEFNHSSTEALRFLQIWVLPAEQDIEPGYEERHISRGEKLGRWCLIVSPDGEQDSLRIHQDVRLYATLLEGGQSLERELAPDRHAWLQVVGGRIEVDSHVLSRGDGLAVSEEKSLSVRGLETAEVLLFDLA